MITTSRYTYLLSTAMELPGVESDVHFDCLFVVGRLRNHSSLSSVCHCCAAGCFRIHRAFSLLNHMTPSNKEPLIPM